MTRTVVTGVLCTLVLLGWSACDDDDPGGDDNIPSEAATFIADVSGSVDADISGSAFSGGVGNGWALVLGVITLKTADGIDGSISIIRTVDGRPGDGTYSISTNPESELYFYASAFINGNSFTSTQGNLVITSSSGTNVRGTFGFDAVGSSGTITIEGGFNATNSTEFLD